MKKAAAILALLTALILLAGCTLVKGEGGGLGNLFDNAPKYTGSPVTSSASSVSDPDQASADFDVKNVLFWDDIRLGGSALSGKGFKVFTDRESFLRALEEAAVDASRYAERNVEDAVVIAVYVTTRTGGWSFAPERVHAADGVLEIAVKAAEPEGEATQAFEDHLVLIAVDRSLWTEGMEVRIDCPGLEAADAGEEY
ncbi:MAG: hypothetical protein J5854_00340 [Clostridia bacterium]|nr:hypothetical protein [Clostridia bacterium]